MCAVIIKLSSAKTELGKNKIYERKQWKHHGSGIGKNKTGRVGHIKVHVH